MIAPVTLLALRRRAGLPRWLGVVGAIACTEQAVETVTIFGSTGFVGREDELAQLQSWYSHVLEGQRRVIFVTGEVGIGKTTFVRCPESIDIERMAGTNYDHAAVNALDGPGDGDRDAREGVRAARPV